MEKDPQERVNQAGNSDYVTNINQRRKQLIKELEGREEGYTNSQKLIVGQTPRSTLEHALT